MPFAPIPRALFPLLAFAVVPTTRVEAQCAGAGLTAADGEAGDRFAESVAANGRTLMVGAPRAGVGDLGQVYVYEREPHGWNAAEVLRPEPGEGGGFGHAVDVLRKGAAVGAPSHAGGGAVYVYEEVGDVWLLDQKLVGSDTAPGDQFGLDVAIFGSTLVVGTKKFSGDGAYVFERIGGTWVETAKLVGPSGMGRSVAVSTDRVVTLSAATAHVFEQVGGAWTEVDGIDFPGAVGDVAISDDGRTLVAGGQSKAFAVKESGGVWGPVSTVLPSKIVLQSAVHVGIRDDGSGFYMGMTAPTFAPSNHVFAFERLGGEWVPGNSYQPNALSFGRCVAWTAGSIIGGAPKVSLHGPSTGKVFVFEDPFETYGEGVPGFLDVAPRIGFEGCPSPSSALGTFVVLGLGGAPGTLVIGLEKAELPLGALTLWTSPILTTLPFVLGGESGAPLVGSVELPLAIPSLENLQGLAFHLQAIVVDVHASGGMSSTPGYRVWVR